MDGRMLKRLTNLGADRLVRKGGDPSIVLEATHDVAGAGRNRTFAGDEPNGRCVDDEFDGAERRAITR